VLLIKARLSELMCRLRATDAPANSSSIFFRKIPEISSEVVFTGKPAVRLASLSTDNAIES